MVLSDLVLKSTQSLDLIVASLNAKCDCHKFCCGDRPDGDKPNSPILGSHVSEYIQISIKSIQILLRSVKT